MQTTYKKISKTLGLLISLVISLSSCALLEETRVEREPSEQEKIFNEADSLLATGDYSGAEALYAKLTRNSKSTLDPIYDKSLWHLAKIYEKQNQSAKALLALDELANRSSNTIPKDKVKFAQIKNHFRVTNFFQAREIKKDLDEDYKNKDISLYDIYENLTETADLNYDNHILEELMFLGEMQKYYLFVMESDMYPENELLTDRLIATYDNFFAALYRPEANEEFKRQLSVALLDQLRKFDQYKIDGSAENANTIEKFSNYSEQKQKKLTEGLNQ